MPDQRIYIVSDSSTSITGSTYGWGTTGTIVSNNVYDSEPQEGETTIDYSNNSKMTTRTNVKQEEVTAEFYFNHVKTKMTKAQKDDLTARMARLTYILDQAPTEQYALREEMQKQLAIVYLQQQAAVLGYDTWVSRVAIDEFRSLVEFKRPELVELKNFPRVIPKEPTAELKKAQSAKLFDSFWILTWNPKAEQLATVTDRVVSKDPILFGQFAFDPDVFYFIADWIDETCDLTLSDMVDNLQQVHPDYNVGTIKPLTAEDLQFLVKQAREKHDLLKNTNQGRWKGDAVVGRLAEEPFSWDLTKRVATAVWQQLRKKWSKKAMK